MFLKYASSEILEVKTTHSKQRVATLDKFASWSDHNYRTDDDYLYVRVRAISSRVNLNNDSWPSDELAKSYRTFIGKPLFVEHNNGDPRRTRGVIVDAKVHSEEERTASLDPYYSSDECWDCHKPPTWVELLLEVDAKTYPKFATAIIKGDIDGFSMGANVERSVCSHCGNEATSPEQFCRHIASKGAYFDYTDPHTGHKTSRRAAEHCYDFHFFELSGVVTPADPTATTRPGTLKHAAIEKEAIGMPPAWFFDSLVAGYVPALAGGSKAIDLWRDYQSKFGEQQVEPKELKNRVEQISVFGGGETLPKFYDQEAPRGGATEHVVTHLDKTADRNDPPQYEAETAPSKVDTLRQERMCPVCGTPGMEDGSCRVCQYVEAPEGFDNPDLEKAKEVDQEMRETPGPVEIENQNDPQIDPRQQTTSSISSDLKSEGDLNSTNLVTANTGGPRGRVRIEEKPALPASRKSSDKPKDARVVEDHNKPVESSAQKGNDTNMSDTQKTADGAEAHGGSDTAPDKRVDVEGVGGAIDGPLEGIEHQDVAKDVNVTGEPTSTWSGTDGQTSPVTNDSFPAGEDGVKAAAAKEAGPKFPDHEPTKVDLHADIAEEVGDRTQTFGDTRNQADPVTKEVGDLIDAHKAAARKHALACIRLAEAEIDLGLTPEDDKYNRVSELEDASQSEIDAQIATLARVRTAGLRKQASARKTTATSMPSLQGRRASVEPSEHAVPASDQDLSDAQAFM